MAKGATGPEEAIETTIGVGDDTGNFSKRSPANKLLLVERGGFGIMYNQNKNQRRARERRTNATQQRARKPQLMTGDILFVLVVIPQLGTATLSLSKNHTTGSASTDRSSYERATSE